MLIAVYMILLIGGMYLVGLAFASPVLQGVIFIAGVLVIAAAVAVPVAAQRFGNGATSHGRRD